MPKGTLIFDVETYSADLLYTLPPEKFVRLIGYKWADQTEVTLTTDLEEIRQQIRLARWIIGHNVIAFDLPAIFGHRSNEPMELADEGRMYDTWVHAVLVNPAPFQYTNRHGKPALASKPEEMKKWFALDEQAYQLGVKGKTHDLKELAKEYGGFGEIPVDDPRYRDYLRGDVLASEAVARALLAKGPLDDYALREQRIASRAAVISSNGLRVDIEAATRRRDELAARKQEILSDLQRRYGLPSEGTAPWGTDQGKVAILAALADYGIKPNKDWPKTPAWEKKADYLARVDEKIHDLRHNVDTWTAEIKGGSLPNRSVAARWRWIEKAQDQIKELESNPLPPAFGLSLSGDTLLKLTKETPAAELGRALAELKGQRSLAQLALDSTHSDGFVHPEITMLQRSGRWSTTNPGLTVWTDKGEGAIEKSYFIPDSEDEVLLEIDYSNADARIVAALSGDRKYAERFEPGADGHTINAIAAWGKEEFERDPKRYRQMAKPLGHGWSYGGGPKGLSRASGLPLETAQVFCEGMAKEFAVLVAWQNKARKGARDNRVYNEWGRPMYVEPGREFTQVPALHGQSGTREIVCDALLRMPYHIIRRVKAQIHDAVLFTVPKAKFEACRDFLVELMETEFKPKNGGQLIAFPVGAGPAGHNWQEAKH